jgi:hypothetical protein
MIVQGVDVTSIMSKMLSDFVPYTFIAGISEQDIIRNIDATFKRNLPVLKQIDITKCNLSQLRAFGAIPSTDLGYATGYIAPQFWVVSMIPEGTQVYFMHDASRSIKTDIFGYNMFPQGIFNLIYGFKRSSTQDDRYGVVTTKEANINIPGLMGELLSMAYGYLVSPKEMSLTGMRSHIMRLSASFDKLNFSDMSIYQLNLFGAKKMKEKQCVYIPMWLLRLLPKDQVLYDVFNHVPTTNLKVRNESKDEWSCYYLKYGQESKNPVVNSNMYVPRVGINISNVEVTKFDKSVAVVIGANLHYSWVQSRFKAGWKYSSAGFNRQLKTDIRLCPFSKLDKETKIENISVILDTLVLIKGVYGKIEDKKNGTGIDKLNMFMKSAETNTVATSNGELVWYPKTLNLNSIQVSDYNKKLLENIVRNLHEYRSLNKMKTGWTYGEKYNKSQKLTPLLVPFDSLDNSEKNYLKTCVYFTFTGLLASGAGVSNS